MVHVRSKSQGSQSTSGFIFNRKAAGIVAMAGGLMITTVVLRSQTPGHMTLSTPFPRHVLAPVGPESPLELRQFVGPVKTDSRGRIITGPNSNDPTKNIVGAQSAGILAGLDRYTKITFAVDYSSGQLDPGQRMDPRAPAANGGSHHWPHVNQPFRSWPTSVALTPDGRKLYVSLPGREGYPDWRIAFCRHDCEVGPAMDRPSRNRQYCRNKTQRAHGVAPQFDHLPTALPGGLE